MIRYITFKERDLIRMPKLSLKFCSAAFVNTKLMLNEILKLIKKVSLIPIKLSPYPIFHFPNY